MSTPILMQASPFLPAPKVPRSPHPSAELVAGVVGPTLAQPLVELEQAILLAVEAVTDLESARPGTSGTGDGPTWRDAIASDADTAAEGTQPKTWKAEALLRNDPHRWATAKALCGAVDVLRAGDRLDRARIATTARTRADVAAGRFATAAREGWETRRDKAAAWGQVRAAEDALAAYTAARQVMQWADGTTTGPVTDVRVPSVDHLPDDPAARGHWLALGLFLEPQTWLHLPQGVVYPADVGELITQALPEAGSRYVALREHGVHAVTR